MNITIGADPEFFVSENDVMVSAYGLVKGDKQNPFPVECGAVQVDGMALEFNIDPAKSKEEFIGNIHTVVGKLRGMIPDKYKFEMVPVAEFGADYIAIQPPEAVEMGCEPDFNAYTGRMNPTPDAAANFRTAAGHVHIGVDRELSATEKRQLVVLCDLFIGLPSLDWDEDQKRRSLYGQAGCYRDKPYGIEYRTLSNAWLKDEETTAFVYEAAVRAVNNLHNFKEIFKRVEGRCGYNYKLLADVINNNNKYKAERFLTSTEDY